MHLKKKPLWLLVLTILALLPLGGCSDSNVAGVRVQKLPIEVTEPCPHPSDVIATVKGSSVGSDEIRMGRLGDALIECGAEKEIAVNANEQLIKILKD